MVIWLQVCSARSFSVTSSGWCSHLALPLLSASILQEFIFIIDLVDPLSSHFPSLTLYLLVAVMLFVVSFVVIWFVCLCVTLHSPPLSSPVLFYSPTSILLHSPPLPTLLYSPLLSSTLLSSNLLSSTPLIYSPLSPVLSSSPLLLLSLSIYNLISAHARLFWLVLPF